MQDSRSAGNHHWIATIGELLALCIMKASSTALIEAKGLKKYFPPPAGLFSCRAREPIRAVEEVSLTLGVQETLAIVGESGCGKTTTARMLLLLENPSAGTIRFEDFDLLKATAAQVRRYRAAVQAVFQDPWSSLNPRMRVRQTIAEPLLINRYTKAEVQGKVAEALRDVGLEQAAAENFPHEFSGGQRQRIAIARAIALRPQAIVLDEPVSALDVSVRAQIMNLLKDLQAGLGISYVLISHDLATVRYLANRVAVMYLGQIVEQADSEALFSRPLHPYTEALIAAARLVRPGTRKADDARPAAAPSARPLSRGCPVAARCPKVFDRCSAEAPALRTVATKHDVACHLYSLGN
jgi:oligopeptide/dipeptide ABC transporter ATP-binding protein